MSMPPQPPILQYQTPNTDPKLRQIALAQRRIMWTILCALLLLISFGFSAALTPTGGGVSAIILISLVALIRIGIVVMMMVGIYQLASALGNGTGTCVLYVIAMIIPCVSLIVLLVVNQQATKILTQNRIKVGLMGARLSDLP
jgi:hypothetical protein